MRAIGEMVCFVLRAFMLFPGIQDPSLRLHYLPTTYINYLSDVFCCVVFGWFLLVVATRVWTTAKDILRNLRIRRAAVVGGHRSPGK